MEKEFKLQKTPELLDKINEEDRLKELKQKRHKVSICSSDLSKRR